MADRIGVSKNGDMGPTGPKCNPLKQTPPVNAREYYNSRVPGARNWKTKTPTQSPSNQTQPTTENNIIYANSIQAQSPQEHSREHTNRPTTPTLNNTLVTETTLHTKCTLQFNPNEDNDNDMCTEPCSIEEAIAAAARANLDYVKINEHMSDVLQDIEDIMLQQVSDVFQLSSWVTRIISIFRLKVCDKQEWEYFNRHFNCETGKITASNPTETIYTPYDTPMTKETRDKLLKSHAELAMAHTTIKNLSEAVVNFSHTSNVVTTHQEAVTPTPQPTLKQTTPLQDTTPPTT